MPAHLSLRVGQRFYSSPCTRSKKREAGFDNHLGIRAKSCQAGVQYSRQTVAGIIGLWLLSLERFPVSLSCTSKRRGKRRAYTRRQRDKFNSEITRILLKRLGTSRYSHIITGALLIALGMIGFVYASRFDVTTISRSGRAILLPALLFGRWGPLLLYGTIGLALILIGLRRRQHR
jgi:hypothetical protein